MALQFDRVRETADRAAALSKAMADLLAEVHQFLEYNSDQAIAWAPPAPKTFTAANATDILTSNAHGLSNGQKVRVSSAGTLPAGLSVGTDYFVIAAAANTLQLSATLGGAAVNFTTDGTGVHSLQPVPDYISLEPNGNLSGRVYAPANVSNAIGSMDQFRNLLTNGVASQGDHLGNFNLLASAPG